MYLGQRRRFGPSFGGHLSPAVCRLSGSPLSAALARASACGFVYRKHLGNAAVPGSAFSLTNVPAAAPASHAAVRGEQLGEAVVAPGRPPLAGHGVGPRGSTASSASPRLASPPGQGSCRPIAPRVQIKKAKTHLSELAALSKS